MPSGWAVTSLWRSWFGFVFFVSLGSSVEWECCLLPTKGRMTNQRIGMCPKYLKDKTVPFSSGFSPHLKSFLRTLVLRNYIRLTPRAAGSPEFRFPFSLSLGPSVWVTPGHVRFPVRLYDAFLCRVSLEVTAEAAAETVFLRRLLRVTAHTILSCRD